MKLKIPFLTLAFYILFLVQPVEEPIVEESTVEAELLSNSVADTEKFFFEIGFTDVHKALQESKDYFKRDISLPTKLPPITFTHQFGRFTNSYGKANEQFEITYINENLGHHHYQIRIKPVKYKLILHKKHIDHTFKLIDGNEGIYSTKFPLDFLTFDKNGWNYTLLVNKQISDTVTKEVLIDIANSIK